ncbi:MAG: DUF11 domain-containing protein, partial [Halobacteriales archaeon]|nr:DUF11 domain-containing protein [Halobacteriales archaeon]
PMVSGAAALLWSAEPALGNDEVADRLAQSAADLGAPGHDPIFGAGALDVACLLLCAQPADLSLAATFTPTRVLFGSEAKLQVDAANAGPGVAYGTTSTTILPRGVRLNASSLPAACTATTTKVTCGLGDVDPGTTASVSLGFFGTAAGNPSLATFLKTDAIDPFPGDTWGSPVFTVLRPGADVGIEMQAPSSLLVGGSFDYGMKAFNGGSVTATGVTATLRLPRQAEPDVGALPAGCTWTATTRLLTCALGTLDPGDVWIDTFPMTAVAVGGASARATVAATTVDPRRSDNQASAVTRLAAPRADLSVTAVPDQATIAVGGHVSVHSRRTMPGRSTPHT